LQSLCFCVLLAFTIDAEAKEKILNPTAPSFVTVTGSAVLFGKGVTSDTLFIQEETVRILNEFKANPYLLVYGSPGIGKSALAQLLVCQELLHSEWVLLHFKGSTSLLKYQAGSNHLERAAFGSEDRATIQDLRLSSLGLTSRDLVMVF
jgi:hypothetical protein